FQLLPKRADGHTKIVDLAFLRRTPCGSKQMRVRQNPTRMLRQLREDRKFLGSEVDLLAVPKHRAPEEVDAYALHLDRSLIGIGTKGKQAGQVAIKLCRLRADA